MAGPEASFRDAPRTNQAVPPHQDFKIQLDKYLEARAKKSLKDSEAAYTLLQDLGSTERILQFLSRARQYFENKSTAPVVDVSEFKAHLKTANWITRNDDSLGFVYNALGNPRTRFRANLSETYQKLPLGWLDKHFLALQIDIRAMSPPEADTETIDSHKVTAITTNKTIGVRYDVLGTNDEKKTLMLALFGNIVGDSYETGFVLALELRESGFPGAFYIIRNLTKINDYEEMSDAEIYDDPGLLKLCPPDGPTFTVARVKSQRPDEDPWEIIGDGNIDIQLEILSDRVPEIVETGWTKDADKEKLVGLFPDLKKAS